MRQFVGIAVLVTMVVMVGMAVPGCKKDPPPPAPVPELAKAAQALEQAGRQMQEASKQVVQAAPEAQANAQVHLAEAMKNMGAAMNGGKKVEPVPFKDLKVLLPEDVAGWKRKEAKGEKTGAMGLALSQVSARYQPPAGATGNLSLKITDVGSLSGPMAMGLAGWASLEIDRESDDEYEKSTTFGGYKAFEKYNSKRKNGELKVLVANRFIVEARGHDVKMADVKEAAGKVDLKKLEGMRSQGQSQGEGSK